MTLREQIEQEFANYNVSRIVIDRSDDIKGTPSTTVKFHIHPRGFIKLACEWSFAKINSMDVPHMVKVMKSNIDSDLANPEEEWRL